MKSLNRTLALVLVLVMVFGLFGVASASSSTFTDAASVGAAYAEAVDVLTGIGAVNGATATTLDPTGNYTREQAAKVVAYISLGKTTAEALACSVAPFSDVAADRWSAGYIQYAVSQGIINGLGDGSFNPTGALTGYQFAKMLLCALGYGKAGEYTGTGWEIAVAKDAIGLKIFKGDATAATNAVISRQQAMLMAFNAMFLGTVKATYAYDNGVKYVASYSSADLTKSFAATAYGYDSTKSLATDAVSALVKVPATVNGVVGYYWYYKGTTKPVTAFYTDQTVIGTSTNGKSLTTLSTFSTTNSYFIAYVNSNTTTGTKYYVNGDLAGTGSTGLSEADDYNGYGVKVEFVDTDDDATTAEKVFVTTYRVDVVAAAPVTAVATGDGKTYVYIDMDTPIGVSTVTGTNAVLASSVTGYADLAVGDVVLVYEDSATPTNYRIVKAASTVAQATSFNPAYGLKIGGTYVADAENTYDGYASSTSSTFNANVTYYKDAYGYIVYAEDVSTQSVDHVVVLAEGRTSSLAGGYAYQDLILKQDGTVAAVTMAADNGATSVSEAIAEGKGATSTTVEANGLGWYTYSISSTTGKYTLAAATGNYASVALGYTSSSAYVPAAITKGVPSITDGTHSVVANSATKFIVYNSTTDTYATYTGIANVPSMSGVYGTALTYKGVATYVYIQVSSLSDTASTANVYIYGLSAKTYVPANATTGAAAYYEVPAIIAGQKTTVKLSATNGAASHLYYVPSGGSQYGLTTSDTGSEVVEGMYDLAYDANGFVFWARPAATLTDAAKGLYRTVPDLDADSTIAAPAGDIITIGGVTYTYTSTAVAMIIDSTAADGSVSVTMTTVAALTKQNACIDGAVIMTASNSGALGSQILGLYLIKNESTPS